MKKEFIAFLVGIIFSLGLGISGMIQPQNVIGFLDLQNWNPKLLFVMIGAIGIHVITYPLIRKRSSPLLDAIWHVPTRRDINSKLFIGSAIFGIGWGLGGFCPGPALASLISGDMRALIFVFTMLIGMLVSLKAAGAVK